MLSELDVIGYTDDSPPPSAGMAHDYDSVTAGDGLGKFNKMLFDIALKNDFIVGYVYTL